MECKTCIERSVIEHNAQCFSKPSARHRSGPAFLHNTEIVPTPPFSLRVPPLLSVKLVFEIRPRVLCYQV